VEEDVARSIMYAHELAGWMIMALWALVLALIGAIGAVAVYAPSADGVSLLLMFVSAAAIILVAIALLAVFDVRHRNQPLVTSARKQLELSRRGN